MDGLKSQSVVGTFEEGAFQLCHKRGYTETDLRVALFDILGYPCVPLLGTYAESYEPTLPVVLLQCDFEPSRVPLAVADAVGKNVVDDVWIQVHGEIPLVPCSHFTCDSTSHVTIVTHTFFYPKVSIFEPDLSLNKIIEIGVFEPHNVREVHQNLERDELGSGVSFGKMGRRECSIHGSAFSPNNCQIDRLQGADVDFFSFWVVAACAGKAAVSFHAIAPDANVQELFRLIASSATTMDELIGGFDAFPMLSSTLRRAFSPTV